MCQLRLIATSSSLLDNGDVKKKRHRVIYVVKCLVVYEVIWFFGQKINWTYLRSFSFLARWGNHKLPLPLPHAMRH